ncbi:DUF2169 domain-containing protein [Massilia sp. CCM 8734]|uniref:DUF2169 family type VI secretion system accessory protein n=1 Tax=Massilia sp. CCM 8734 TaxID=2609283 RepID=UPI001422E6E8|nr:DUF2169 domain-containing protein [Massilia sp. CCM 8734]NIA00891.1 DUF2169 domain-containing protein [Massilia sp. CCM 8734]
MEIIVASRNLIVDIAVAADVSGREHLVVMTKGTWQIPAPGERARPIPAQAIEQTDIYVGDAGQSAMLYGSDIVRFKPRCDVLFNASAHSPHGEPVKELSVAWQVGPLRKGAKVHGERQWKKRLGMVSLTNAEPFTQMPLHFGKAFGGTRKFKEGWGANAKTLTEAHLVNPAGIGWFGSRTDEGYNGQPAPNLEALDDPVRHPNSKQKPVAFSAIARNWHPRPSYGGTYDEDWRKNVFPFLPEDFDDQFNQCAPDDQQMPYPKGNEQVVLHNMVAGRSDVRFKLPKLDALNIRILRTDYSTEELVAVADTLYFEPDQKRFSVVWRATVPIKKRIHEFSAVAVGSVSQKWWRDKSMGVDSCTDCVQAPGEDDLREIA